MNRKTILLVEDDKKVQSFNKRLLAGEGFAVQTAITLADAGAFLARQTLDIIVLDIGMPDGNGLDFLKELRRTSTIPVLMLTGYGESSDVLKGFDSGCDDYLKKPYKFTELLVRIKRLLYRVEQVPETVSRGSLTLRLASREAFVGGDNLDLTPKDYALLQFFVQNEGRIMQMAYIYETVWGQPMAGDSRALGNAISRLRRKLTGCGYTITADYGNGYVFERGEP